MTTSHADGVPDGTSAGPTPGPDHEDATEPSALERRQAGLYAAAATSGLAIGTGLPVVRPVAEALLWPALFVLMLTTFTQTPLSRVRRAGRDRRWTLSVMTANFVLVPLTVGCLVAGVRVAGNVLHGAGHQVEALALGLTLVLLVPCTDWFLTFVHLARGDRAAAAAITPVNLVVQVLALPLWLWVFAGDAPLLSPAVVLAAAGTVALPLTVAAALEPHLDDTRRAHGRGRRRRAWLGRWPIPALAVVVLLVGAARGPDVLQASGVLWLGALVCAVYLAAAVLIGVVVAGIAGLGEPQRRALVCTLGTRNSFVVLPLAVALPVGWEVAAAAVVVQSLVELVGMGLVVRWLRGVGQRP